MNAENFHPRKSASLRVPNPKCFRLTLTRRECYNRGDLFLSRVKYDKFQICRTNAREKIMLDPITIGAFLLAFGAVSEKVLDKLVVEPLMKPAIDQFSAWLSKPIDDKKKQDAFAKAINVALNEAARGEAISREQKTYLEGALAKLDENARAELMARVFLATQADNAWLVDEKLLRALGVQENQRASVARFLGAWRLALAAIPEIKPILDVAHQQNVENALRVMYPHLALLSSTVQIVDGIPAVGVTTVKPKWKPTAFLDAMAQEFRRLRLGALETSALKADAEPIFLDEIYTDLDVMDTVHLSKEKIEKRKQENPFLREEQQTRRMTAIEAVSWEKEPRVVLLGAPGSGKSAFVNFLAHALTREQLNQGDADGIRRLPRWQLGTLFPTRLVLRELVEWADENDKTHADADTLWDFIQANAMFGYKQEFAALKEHLQTHGGILLLDGLDEVRDADERRVFCKEAIEHFDRAHRNIRIVVTCRPYAYENREWALRGFHPHTLAPFDDSQIKNFTRVWYQVVGAREGWSEKLIEEKTSDLVSAAQMEHLKKLAEQPLLLTLMATLNAKGKLPEDRADLYDKTVELLLDEWQKQKGGGLNQFGLTVEKLQSVMARVALDAHTRQGSAQDRKADAVADIAREELRDALAPELNNSVDMADKVVAYMQTRAGLLLPQTTKTYTFPHRSFQEFMAACEALNSPEFPLDLVERVRADRAWWREVYLLAAGRIHAKQFPSAVSLIENLCEQDCPASPRINLPQAEARDALLAAQAAVDIDYANELPKYTKYPKFARLLKRLQTWLVAILESENFVTRERIEAGVLLAKLGDPRPGVHCPPLLEGEGLGERFLFCEIPAGNFIMGSKPDDEEAFSDEQPQFTYTIPNNFYITRYPITNAQFQAFEDDPNGYANDEWWTDAGLKWRGERTEHYKFGGVFDLPNHPVVGVTWFEAVAFCSWATKRLEIGEWRFQVWTRDGINQVNLESLISNLQSPVSIRLPSEAEWERAARAEDGRTYPWGEDIDAERANYDATGLNTTSAVGAFPRGASKDGVLDLSGNVWEWTSSRWGKDFSNPDFKYPYRADDGREDLGSNDLRVWRGGAFDNAPRYVRCACRGRLDPGNLDDYPGFRVVVSPVRL